MILDKVILAGKEGGWVLALIVALTALALAALTEVNPVEEAAKPVVSVLAPAASQCPSGWSDVSERDSHGQVLACERNGWLVILNPDRSFSHGFQVDTPGAEFKFSPAEVPGWPR